MFKGATLLPDYGSIDNQNSAVYRQSSNGPGAARPYKDL
ncbi:hypothetical protein PHO31112_00878 [Pandoraea horticolens]|uniref:Uncharacterized protein n=1 Tax=Pandoraea horticolens TaxID=2508298 RepID=A0A5E4SLN0_9BURK|nr:hypothetical protein PHO31112_00878 [Pandoraea horticolens]